MANYLVRLVFSLTDRYYCCWVLKGEEALVKRLQKGLETYTDRQLGRVTAISYAEITPQQRAVLTYAKADPYERGMVRKSVGKWKQVKLED